MLRKRLIIVPVRGEAILVLNEDFATKQRAFSFIH